MYKIFLLNPKYGGQKKVMWMATSISSPNYYASPSTTLNQLPSYQAILFTGSLVVINLC